MKMNTLKNQQEISDEILNRLHSLQFKSEDLLSNNDAAIQLVSLRRQYMNEIHEAYSNNIIDAATYQLIAGRLQTHQRSYFDDQSFFDNVNAKMPGSFCQLSLRLSELKFQDFELFKRQYETEQGLESKDLSEINNNYADTVEDDNESVDYLFDSRLGEGKPQMTIEPVGIKNNSIETNKFHTNEMQPPRPTNNYIQKSNSFNYNTENSNSPKSGFRPSNFLQPQAPAPQNAPSNNYSKVTTLKYEPRFTKSYKRRNDDKDEEDEEPKEAPSNFKSAKEQLLIDNNKKNNNNSNNDYNNSNNSNYNNYNNNNCGNAAKKSLGTTKRLGIHSKFNLPIRNNEENEKMQTSNCNNNSNNNVNMANNNNNNNSNNTNGNGQGIDTSNIKNIDQKLIDIITGEIMDHTPPITWQDIAGLEHVKKTIKEIVIWPMLRPDIFNGLRGPPKGLLLFGPPGTGKTLIAKCIANESKSKFFNISSSCLTSKWQGESEKLVKVLFEVARSLQPSVIFIDEIDSLLAQRSDDDRESSRRLKTEFFVQMDGARTTGDERILLIGATNRPQELDDAARRRFVKRLYIPLPDIEGRKQIVTNLMRKQPTDLTDEEIDRISDLTDGYSGADMGNLCREAALGPIRTLEVSSIETIDIEQVRSINFHDFQDAMQQVRASVSQTDLEQYITWNSTFGSIAIK